MVDAHSTDPDGPATRRSVPGGWAPVLLAAAGVVVNLVAITGPALWTDEAATVSAATRSWSDLVRMSRTVDVVHLLYYSVMHLWVSAFGTSELALRLPSAIGVGLVAAGVWVLAVRLTGDRGMAAMSAVVMILLPRATWMGVEARSYAFVTAAAVWSTLALAVALDRGGIWRWVRYGLVVVVGVALNLYVVLLVLAHGVTIMLLGGRRRRTLLPWAAASAGAALMSTPLVLVARGESAQIGTTSIGPVELARNVLVNQWFLGETPTLYTHGAGPTGDSGALATAWRFGGVALALTSVALVVWWLWRRRRTPDETSTALVIWAVPWAVLPTVALGAYALVAHTYNPRYTSFSTPAVAILLAAALFALRSPRLIAFVATLLLACAAPVMVSQRTENAKSGSDWRQVARVVGRWCAAGDGVYFAPRAAPTDAVVKLTTRGVAVAYPRPFVDLVDLTLQRTPAQAADLTGRSTVLSGAGDRLAVVDAVCVVRRHDLPGTVRDADDRTFEVAGFHPVRQWSGPLSEVVLMGRPG